MDREEAQVLVGEFLGEEVIPLIRALFGKEDYSEFKLAEDIDMNVNQARAILYKLNQSSLATFIKKKDAEQGWYVCYWTLDILELEKLKIKLRVSKLSSLVEKLEKESTTQFFLCKNNCLRVDFENAFHISFSCPECGCQLDLVDNSGTMLKIKDEIRKIDPTFSF